MWDINKMKKVSQWRCHKERVGSISVHEGKMLTGSRDKHIYLFDLKAGTGIQQSFSDHSQEVCGLKWSPNGEYFASGGNDNKLFIYSPKIKMPLLRKKHKAAVKALGWSKRTRGILATGAGTADRCLRVFNTQKGKMIEK